MTVLFIKCLRTCAG